MNTLTKELRFQLYGDADIEGQNLLRQSRALHRAIPLIAQSLVEKLGTKISIKRMRGAGGKTDGRNIWLMDGVLPQDSSDMDRFLVYVALKVGLVHHEIGHVNETDFMAPADKLDPLARHFLGIIEDVRQENAHIRRFKAGRKYLDALSLASIITGLNGPVRPGEPMIGVMTSYLLFTLRNRYRNEPCFSEFAEGARDEMIARLGLSVVTRVEVMFSRVPGLKNTTDAIALAEDLSFLLREEEKKAQQQQQKQQQQQQQQQQSDDSQQGNPSGQPEDDQDDPQQDQDDGDSDDGAGQDSSADDDGQASDDGSQDSDGQQDDTQQQTGDSSDANGTSNGDGDGEDSDVDASQLVQVFSELFNGDPSDAKGDLDEQVRKMIDSLKGDISKGNCTPDDLDLESVRAGLKDVTTDLHLSSDDGRLCEAVSAVARLSARLKQKLQAQSIAKTSRSTTGAKIVPKHLTGIAQGDSRIFRKTSSGVDTDTAVFLLGDVSGSMSGTPIIVSNQAMYATALAMQRLPGVDVAVAAFPGRQMVLRFGERARQHEGRFNLAVTGCTPLDEGVLMAHSALMYNRRPRKMLMVCTDGDPDDFAKAQASLDYAKSCGIEVFGIGIQTDAVQHLFDKWAVVNDVHDLPAAMLSMLSTGLGVELKAVA